MTDKELRKLSRADLLEMLLEQTKLVDKLKIELEETKLLFLNVDLISKIQVRLLKRRLK